MGLLAAAEPHEHCSGCEKKPSARLGDVTYVTSARELYIVDSPNVAGCAAWVPRDPRVRRSARTDREGHGRDIPLIRQESKVSDAAGPVILIEKNALAGAVVKLNRDRPFAGDLRIGQVGSESSDGIRE